MSAIQKNSFLVILGVEFSLPLPSQKKYTQQALSNMQTEQAKLPPELIWKMIQT